MLSAAWALSTPLSPFPFLRICICVWLRVLQSFSRCSQQPGIVAPPPLPHALPAYLYLHLFESVAVILLMLSAAWDCRPGLSSPLTIHVIFFWTQIGRFGFSDREIRSQIGRFFRGKKYSILVPKIVICSTVDHCKMFYLPEYC